MNIYRRLRNRYFVLQPLVRHVCGGWTNIPRRVRVEHDELARGGLAMVRSLINEASAHPPAEGMIIDAAELKFLREHEQVSVTLFASATLKLTPMERRGGGRFRGADRDYTVASNATSRTFYEKLQRAFEDAT
jgi:hypothetical protein